MAYKKYIKRNGKLYGPYIYHSRRVNGKVTSEYRGATNPFDYKKFIFIFFGVLFVLGLGYGVISNKVKLTGNVAMDLETNYLEAQELKKLEGIVNISLSQGEFIPASSKLVFETSKGNYTEYTLENLLDEKPTEGDFYIQGRNLSGNGSGYGIFVGDSEENEKKILYVNLSELNLVLGGNVKISITYDRKEIISLGTLIQEGSETTENPEEEVEIHVEEVIVKEIIPEEIEVIEDTLPLSDEEKQILINEFGNQSVESEVSLFKDRIIVRYEFAGMWIENSYDAELSEVELEVQMQEDRIRWLRDIINNILSEETLEEELEGFEESYSI